MSLLEVVLLCLLLAVVSFGVVRWLFSKDTEIEDRRRAAAQLAAKLQSYGLLKVPAFLIDYSVGDYSGMAHRIRQLVETFASGEDAVAKEFEAVFGKCLEAKLLTSEGRALVAAKLSDAAAGSDASVVQNAPQATTVAK